MVLSLNRRALCAALRKRVRLDRIVGDLYLFVTVF
jgi:hypothetical protein